MKIDRVVPTDIDAILEMAAELSAHENMRPPTLSAEKLGEVLFGADAFVFGLVARKDEACAGYALWDIDFDMQSGSRVLHVIDLFVKPDFRKSGIGRALMREMARIGRERGCTEISVQAMAHNPEANAFYPACGGKRDNTVVYVFEQAEMDAI